MDRFQALLSNSTCAATPFHRRLAFRLRLRCSGFKALGDAAVASIVWQARPYHERPADITRHRERRQHRGLGHLRERYAPNLQPAAAAAAAQGLTLVRFSAQPEARFIPKLLETTQRIPQQCSR
jgi:hypothetical protein